MKKLLALVLALVMTLGLATVSSSAAYSDEADVSLNEAVDVMSAVGVFQGADGKFSPKENLTREQAAKLIAYLDLGESAAEALPGVKVFSDVEATRWSAKYIAYCQDAGYIAGVGNGKFNPTGELTGYAFGKMVLCVLGYDADIEGFTGNAWSINVAKLMESNDIADGVSGAASATLTREQAAQYCLNALKADMVEYDTKGTSIEINGAKIATGASKATAVKDSTNVAKHNVIGKENSGKEKDNTVTTVQLGEKLYDGDLKLTKGTDTSFKAPAVKWTYKNSEVDTYADAPTATYTGKVTKGTIYTLLGKDVVDDLNDQKAEMYLAIDGRYQKIENGELAGTTEGTVSNIGKNYIVKNSSAAAFGTGNGMTTEVYVDDNGNNGYALIKVIVKNTYVMKATADYNAKTEKLSVTDLSNKVGNSPLKADDFAVEGFEKDDYILYTAADEGTYNNKTWKASWKIQTIEKAPVVSGKVDSFALKDSVTLDGTKYSYSATLDPDKKDADNGRAVPFAIGDTATVVLDGQDNIIYVDEAKASNDDVVFVKSVGQSGFDLIAKVVTVDGKKMTVTVDDDSYYVANNKNTKITYDNKANFETMFCAYEVKNNEYKLTPYGSQTTIQKDNNENTVALNKQTTLNGKTANSSTLYIIEDEDGDINLYTGVKNAPKTVTVGNGNKAYLTFNSSDEVVYVYAKGAVEDTDSSSDQMIYILKAVGDTVYKDSNKNEYVEAKALVNGEEKTLQIKKDSDAHTALTVAQNKPVIGTLYKSMTVDSNGYITKLSAAVASTANAKTKYASWTVTNKKDAVNFNDDVVTIDGTAVQNNDKTSSFVKTNSVYVVLFKTIADNANVNAALMNDDNADYEIVEVNDFEALENFVKGYTISGGAWVLYDSSDSDAEITGAYVGITASVEGQVN